MLGWMLALLDWSSGTWAVVFSAIGLMVAVAARFDARRAAKAAEESAEQQRRAADLAEQGLSLERERSHREVGDYTERVAPLWEASAEGPDGFFRTDGSHMLGSLRNSGLHGARILVAALDVAGPRAGMQTRCRDSGDDQWQDEPHVPPGSVLELRCDLSGLPINSDARPMVYMDYDAPGLNHPMFGVTIELLRRGVGANGQPQWKVGAIRNDLRP
jgi:hypothetical protein